MIELLALPLLDRSRTSLLLPSPTKLNTGGFKLPAQHVVLYEYSPVDIFVCGMESLGDSTPIRNLSQWFLQNEAPRKSEQYAVLGLLINEEPVFKSVLDWRTEPLPILKKLAPFTFRK